MTTKKEEQRFEAVIVWRQNPETGARELLVLDYEPKDLNGQTYGAVQVKFPGGRSEPGEAESEAAIRELAQETGLVIRRQNRRHLQFIHRVHKSGIVEVFFAIQRKHCGGKIRGDVVEEKNSRLSNRRFVPEGPLPFSKLHPSHLEHYKVMVSKPRSSGSRLALTG